MSLLVRFRIVAGTVLQSGVGRARSQSVAQRRPAALVPDLTWQPSLHHRASLSSLQLMAMTVIPRHLDKLSRTEERDISIGEVGDVSIGDLHGRVR